MGLRMMVAAAAMATAAGFSGAAVAESAAKAELMDRDKKEVGTVELVQTAHGVLLDVRLKGLPQGTHAFHIHETGKCEPPFKSAGGHFNPDNTGHGVMDGDGMHAGDLPNIHMTADTLRIEVLAQAVTLDKGKKNSLLDSDGSAIVIHQDPDDYFSDPAGKAGDRIACGIIKGTE